MNKFVVLSDFDDMFFQICCKMVDELVLELFCIGVVDCILNL